ncbi:hypothetical protein CCR75_001332 [Bremia lactucae]|uniref:Uncharacterized protein n=1 Tax=Bremia lactucae TaxID=4779 RepID=A0A976FFH1_BRELC|nr:hypothetical protein CCR75_001332 [Bremia lactucae]
MPSLCSPPPGGGGTTEGAMGQFGEVADPDDGRVDAITPSGGLSEESAPHEKGGGICGLPGGSPPGEAPTDGHDTAYPITRMGLSKPVQPAHSGPGHSSNTSATDPVNDEEGTRGASNDSTSEESMPETSAQPPALHSVSLSEMFTALVEELAETPHSKPVQACTRAIGGTAC